MSVSALMDAKKEHRPRPRSIPLPYSEERIAENEAYFQVAMLCRNGGQTMADTITTLKVAGRSWRHILDHLLKSKPR